MEVVTQIFFPGPQSVPRESCSPRLQKGKEVFGEFVQKECEQVTGEKQDLPEDLTASLKKEIEALIESFGGISAEEEKALTEQLMDKIKELLSSGQEEEVLSFLQGLLQVETQEGFAECVESFLALDTASEWGAEALETNQLFTGISAGEQQDMPGDRPEETIFQAFAGPEERAAEPALNREAVTRAFSVPEENSQALDAGLSDQEQVQGTQTGDVLSRLSARTIEQIHRFLSRRQEGMNGQARGDIRSLMENTIFIKDIEVGQPAGVPSPEEQIAPEQVMEAKLSLLQDIKEMVHKAEFKQGLQNWQAKVELKPEQLGNTILRVEMNDDKATLSITVARPEAQELVQNSLKELQQIFSDKGIVIENVSVDIDPQMQFDQGWSSRERADSQERFSSRISGAGEGAGSDFWDSREIYSPEHLFLEREGVNCFA